MIKKTVIVSIIAIYMASNIYAQTLEIPELTNVTVDISTQMVNISWNMQNSNYVDGYIIKRKIFGQQGVVSGSVNTIATISNNNKFSYIDSGNSYGYAMPGSRFESYRVVSFKNSTGGKVLYSNMSKEIASIYLSPIEFDLCKQQNKLEWTAYEGFGNDLKSYKIYYSHNTSSKPIFIKEINSSETYFVHCDVSLNKKYYYYVQAVANNNIVSWSNRQLIKTRSKVDSKVMNADYATVIDKNKLKLFFTLDKNAKVHSYILLKSNNIEGEYDTLSILNGGGESITYIDPFKTKKEIRYYKLVAVDECGKRSTETNVANNIVLKAKASKYKKLVNNLSWNAYEGWRGGVQNYYVYRSFDGADYEKIATLSPENNEYQDNIKYFISDNNSLIGSHGRFCYYVEAIEGDKNPYGIKGKSKSNFSCTYQEAIVYLPNAINPKSQFEENRTFKPIATFVSDYQLTIYDRWGGIIFKSNNPMEGWDGRKNGGELLMKGTYMFYLRYRSKNKKLVKTSGEINLVY